MGNDDAVPKRPTYDLKKFQQDQARKGAKEVAELKKEEFEKQMRIHHTNEQFKEQMSYAPRHEEIGDVSRVLCTSFSYLGDDVGNGTCQVSIWFDIEDGIFADRQRDAARITIAHLFAISTASFFKAPKETISQPKKRLTNKEIYDQKLAKLRSELSDLEKEVKKYEAELAGRKPNTGAMINHSRGPSSARDTSHVGKDASQRLFASCALGCRGSMSRTSTKRRRPMAASSAAAALSSSLCAAGRARARVQCRGVGGSHADAAHA